MLLKFNIIAICKKICLVLGSRTMLRSGNTMKLLSFSVLLLFLVQQLEAKVTHLRCSWRSDPATSMVISWHQASGHSPEICFGVIDGGTDTNIYPNCEKNIIRKDFKGMRNNFARLTNLYPDTEYYFIIVDSEGTSERYSFKTAPADPGATLSIIAGGDSRNYRKARVRANKMVAKLRPDFVLFGGDMTGGDSSREWIEWFSDWQHTIAADGHLTPIVAARGNHEYSNATIAELFDVPNPQVYYKLSFAGNLLEVYTLNSLIASGGNQKEWLKRELEASHGAVQWKMAQYHYAIRPHTLKKRERNNQLQNWGKLFDQYQMDLVCESDAHVVKTTWPVSISSEPGSEEGFIRDDINGTVYVGEGCWGAPLRRNNDDKSWTRNSGSFNQFKWIFVNSTGVEVRTVKVDNVDEVQPLESYNRFSLPPGIDIWNPSHGSVIYIPPRRDRDNSMVAKTVLVSDNRYLTPEIDIQNASIQPNLETGKLDIQWNVEKFTAMNRGFFLVQEETEQDGVFNTCVKVEASRDVREFNFSLDRAYNERDYRLVFTHPGIQSRIFSIETILPKSAVPEKLAENELRPDPNSGYLRVRYNLSQPSDVDIKLLNRGRNESLVRSQYQNQRKGNYLKSIDMTDYPNGDYQLVIRINEEVIREYKVTK